MNELRTTFCGMPGICSFLGRLVLAFYDVCMTGAKNRFYYHGETLIQLGNPAVTDKTGGSP